MRYEKLGMTSDEIAEMISQPYRTMMRWKTYGLFEPIPKTKERPRSQGLEYDLKNVQKALTIAKLRDQGVSLQKVRDVIDALDDYNEDLATAVLYTDKDGENVYQVKDREDLDFMDLVDSPGQLTTSEFIDLGEVAEEAREAFEQKVA